MSFTQKKITKPEAAQLPAAENTETDSGTIQFDFGTESILSFAYGAYAALYDISTIICKYMGADEFLDNESCRKLGGFCSDMDFFGRKVLSLAEDQREINYNHIIQKNNSLRHKQNSALNDSEMQAMLESIDKSINILNNISDYGGEKPENLQKVQDLIAESEETVSWFYSNAETIVSLAAQYGNPDWWWYSMWYSMPVDSTEVQQSTKSAATTDELKQNLKSLITVRANNLIKLHGRSDKAILVPGQKDADQEKAKSSFKTMSINTLKGIVTGIAMPVGSPDRVYLDGDYYPNHVIESCQSHWTLNEPFINMDHNRNESVPHWEHPHFRVLQNYLAPCDFMLNGQPVLQGDWMMSWIGITPEAVQAIADGYFNGFSAEVWYSYHPEQALARA